MGLDERIKCPECGSAEFKTIKGKPDNVRKKIRVCKPGCSKDGELLSIYEK